MRFTWLHLPLLIAAIAAGPGCSVQDDGTPDPPPPGVPGPNATLRFDVQGTLELAPGEERSVTIATSPPAPYEVSFSIVGDTSGAWLDRTTTAASTAGRATVVLHAPSVATTFRLRAVVKDGPSADLNVSVSDKGFAPLRITPLYAGQRLVTEWTASVKAGTTCAEIAAILPEDPEGALVGSAPADAADGVSIMSAPVGPNLAVALRAGRALWGCSDVADLEAGTERAVVVSVKDGPLALASTNLDLTLTFALNSDVSTLIQANVSRVMDSFLPDEMHGSALLDTMEALTATDLQDAFADRRQTEDWDDLADEHLANLPSPLPQVCRTWAETGLATLTPQISARLRGIDQVPDKAWLEVTQFGGVPAANAGVPSTAHQVSWTSEPGDVLRLDGRMYWIPSRYVGAAAREGALATLPPEASMAEALSAAADCEGLAATLGGFSGCDQTCMLSLCTSALDARWTTGIEASASTSLTGTVAVAASGAATIDQEATPVGWGAAWLGKISDGDTEATVQGQATAVESSTPIE
ncbi:hypothetical protein [Chondromyces apiculatus]|uniref:Uncharacterized protein n=1 Tax=Chondromyces apiculatus DSM 436 TaxID=1192034 RepID=A0A017SVQ4_9BACT|nr:hypothetical protein [Chondromyces apiculatus]EYF00695.1 Hypothetical protein CAP_0327 [Chondromyces apiculatus DSM 436]